MVLKVSGASELAERFPQHRRRLLRRLQTMNQVSREQVHLLRALREGRGDDHGRRAYRPPAVDQLRGRRTRRDRLTFCGSSSVTKDTPMSFTHDRTGHPAPAPLRTRRAGHPDPALFEKAANSAADVIFLDLEDAVAPDDKAQARKNVVPGSTRSTGARR